MIISLLTVYEMVVGIGVIVGIMYLLYSDEFLVMHRRFLGLIAIGMVVTVASKASLLFYWPAGIQVAHLVTLLFITGGLYSLLAESPTNRLG